MKKPLGLVLALLCLSGCARPLHARQLEELQPVQTLGYDAAPGEVTVSVSDRKSAQGEDAVRMAARGESLVRACEELQNFTARGELFFAHVRFALAGEAAAKAGLSQLLDWFTRSAQARLRLPLFLVRGGSARELVTGSEDDAYEITALLSALEEQTRRRGELCCWTVLDILRALNEHGAALCCALEPREAGENAPSAEEGALTALAAGYGVLKGDRLCGWLDPAEARGATILLNRAGEISYTLPDGDALAVVTLRSVRARREPGGEGRARVEAEAGLTALWAPGELTPSRLAALEAALAERLGSECSSAIAASRDLGADFLGLGLTEAALRSLDDRVSVRVRITQSYDSKAGPVKKEAVAYGYGK